MINILGSLDLKSRRYEPTPEQLNKLRHENPLQAALYMIQAGKLDEAESLVQEAQRRLKAEVTGAMEAKYKSQLAALQEQLEAMTKQRQLDQKQIAELQLAIQSLTLPPFSRAILLKIFQTPLKPDEWVKQLKGAIVMLQAIRILFNEKDANDQETINSTISLLTDELSELEESVDSNQSLDKVAVEEDNSESAQEPINAYRAIIAVGAGRYEVNIHNYEPLPEGATVTGREVWTAGDAMTVVDISRGYAALGTAAEVARRIDDERIQVKGRGGEEFVVQMTPELAMIEDLGAGDIVRVLSEAELGLELLEKATKKLALEQIPTETYDDIGGMDEMIDEIRKAVELPFIFRNVYGRYRLKRPKGILLYGPPGCGKTMVAKAIANSLYSHTEKALKNLQSTLIIKVELDKGGTTTQALAAVSQAELSLPEDLLIETGASADQVRETLQAWFKEREIAVERAESELRRVKNRLQEGAGSYFFSIKGPELLSKWVGESEHNIRRIFATAREKATQETPVVLFFDEIESMFSRRGSGRSSDMEKTIVPQLLAEIDGINSLPNVLVIGASNRYDLIDPAVLRPGRLDIKIRVDRPTKGAARDIISKYLVLDLPIDKLEIQRNGSNKEQAVKSLIHKVTDVIYDPGSYIVVYRRDAKGTKLKRRETVRKALTEVISGAMLANIVERAKRSAAERETNSNIVKNKDESGINWDDLYQAIERECKESKDQYIFEARDAINEMAYLDADLFEAEVILKDETEGGRPIARWARFKERPWFNA